MRANEGEFVVIAPGRTRATAAAELRAEVQTLVERVCTTQGVLPTARHHEECAPRPAEPFAPGEPRAIPASALRVLARSGSATTFAATAHALRSRAPSTLRPAAATWVAARSDAASRLETPALTRTSRQLPAVSRRGSPATARPRPRWRDRAFSLIEVVAAVGIFAIGMVAVLGMFAPVTKSVAGVAEAEAAARVADAVRARVQALPFDRALALVQEAADVRRNDGNPNYNANDGTRNPKVLFGKLSGDVGLYDPAEGKKAWYDASVPTPLRVDDADKFFEIDLIRNDTLSPRANDATAALVAYNVRVRWPAFVRASSGAAVQVGANPVGGGQVPFDQSRKQVLFFTGSIQR